MEEPVRYVEPIAKILDPFDDNHVRLREYREGLSEIALVDGNGEFVNTSRAEKSRKAALDVKVGAGSRQIGLPRNDFANKDQVAPFAG